MSDQSDEARRTRAFGTLIAAYPKSDVGETQVAVYKKMLSDIPTDLLEAAILQIVAESKWFPKVSEVREKAHELHRAAAGVDSPEEAWETVQRAIRTIGPAKAFYNGRPRFHNQLTARAIDSVGWKEILTTDKPGVTRAHFLKVYKALLERDEQEQRYLPEVAQLVDGLAEQMRLEAPDPKSEAPQLKDGDRAPQQPAPYEGGTMQISILAEAWAAATAGQSIPAAEQANETAKRMEEREWYKNMTDEERKRWDALHGQAQRRMEQAKNQPKDPEGETDDDSHSVQSS